MTEDELVDRLDALCNGEVLPQNTAEEMFVLVFEMALDGAYLYEIYEEHEDLVDELDTYSQYVIIGYAWGQKRHADMEPAMKIKNKTKLIH